MNTRELQNQLAGYLKVRAALGYKDRGLKSLLQSFLDYIVPRADDGSVRSAFAVDWAYTTPVARGAGVAGPAHRLSAARGFLRHLHASDPNVEVPQVRLLAVARSPRPYLFSSEEIARLLKAASALGPRGSLRPHTYETILGLMASTGIRVGEAIRLKNCDVQLEMEPPVLRIRETKFGKHRVVVLHPTTAKQLTQYVQLRRRLGYGRRTDAFFVSEQGGLVSYACLCRWFARTTQGMGMHPPKGRRTPTLHGLRHYFAVERLTLWCQQGACVLDLAPHLSVYLGHAKPQQSYWYMTATPALLSTAAESFQRFTKPGGAP